MSIVLKTSAEYIEAGKKVEFLSKTVPMTRKVANKIKNLKEAMAALEERSKRLIQATDLVQTGYAGVDKNGQIVDRRINKDAVPVQAGNGAPEPKPI